MKYILLTILWVHCLNIFSQRWSWASDIDGKGMERAWDMKINKSNQILVAGQFSDTLYTLDNEYACLGVSDIFVSCINPDGSLQWLKTFGSISEDVALGIGTDSLDNVYIAGYFTGVAYFDTFQVTAMNSWDLYIVKMDPEGMVRWVKTVSGNQSELAYGLAVNSAGDVFITGWYQDTIWFSPQVYLTNYGGSDILVAKYNSEGALQWARHAGTAGIEYGYKIAADNNGNCYVTGVASAGSQFDSLILPGDGAFIVKYAADGSPQWINVATGGAAVNDIAANDEGWGYISGRYFSAGIFGEISLESVANSDDGYLARFNVDGSWQWALSVGGRKSDKGRAVNLDKAGNAYFTGTFIDTLQIGDSTIFGLGANDIFMAKVNPEGIIQWIASAGGPNIEVASDIALDADTHVYLCGWYFGKTFFGNYSLTTTLPDNLNMFYAGFDPFHASSVSNDIKESIRIWPNPIKEKLNFSLPSGKIILHVSIYRMDGQMVYSEKLKAKQEQITLSNLPDGIYMIEFSGLWGIQTAKIVKF